MPALPDVPSVIRVDFKHTEDEDPGLGNRFFYKYSGGAPAPSDLNSFATQLSEWWGDYLAELAHSVVTLVSIVVTDLTSPTSARGEWAGSVSGTRSSTPLPVNDCALQNYTIARRYRGGKPRTYSPWGTVADLESGSVTRWGSSFVTLCDSQWSTYESHVIGAGMGPASPTEQVNVSYYSGFLSVQDPITLRWRNIPTPRSAAVVDAITAHALNPIVGSQRRRLRA